MNKDTSTTEKKKLKVRIPSKLLKKAVKKKVKVRVSSKLFKKNLLTLRKKKKKVVESESPTKKNSTLSAVKRFVRVKRNVKVHPITSTK